MPGREVTKQVDAKDDSKKKHKHRERERETERGREREREKEEANPGNSEALDPAKRRKRKREKKKKKEKEKEKEKESEENSSSSSSSSVVVIGEVDKSSLLAWVESGLPAKQRKAKKPIDERVWKYVVKSSVVPGVVTPTPTRTPAPTLTRALVPVQAPLLVPFDSGVQKNTRTLQIFAWDRRISVTVTSEAACVSNWLATQLARGRGSSFGLDVEWQPNVRKGCVNKVSIMQISGAEECLIIQLLYLDSIPGGLPDFLARSSLAGVGVASDAAKLSQDYGLLCPNTVELTKLASEKLDRKEFMHAGLKALASEILGLQMRKPKPVTMSNWARRSLELAQIEYACLDAWVSFALFSKLETGSV